MTSPFAAPEGYEAMMGRWSRPLAELFLDFAGAPAADARVLDVGCGTGSLTFALAQRAIGRIVGIDPSLPFVAFAQRRSAAPGRVAFLVGDARALPFADASFDAIVSLLVLNFVPEADRALAELRRVARPGGRIAAAVWDFYGGMGGWRMFWDTAAVGDDAASRARDQLLSGRFTHPGELGMAWRDLGLKDVEEGELRLRMRFADFADYWGPFEKEAGLIGVYVSRLRRRQRSALTERLRAAFLGGRPDGPRSFTATGLAVRGRR